MYASSTTASSSAGSCGVASARRQAQGGRPRLGGGRWRDGRAVRVRSGMGDDAERDWSEGESSSSSSSSLSPEFVPLSQRTEFEEAMEAQGLDSEKVPVATRASSPPKSIEEYDREFALAESRERRSAMLAEGEDKTAVQKFLFPDKEQLPDDVEMSIWEHLDELRERVLVSVVGVGVTIVGCFAYSKQLVEILEAPVADKGVKFLQLSPGEFFFTSFKVAGYTGLLLGAPLILYEIIAFVLPGLTVSERKFLGPIVLGSSVLFYVGLFFSYAVLTPAALTFFVSYADGAVESLWSIDKYFEFVLVLMLSTGLSFQVPVIQVLLGQTGLVNSDTMFGAWRYVVVGSVVAAAVLTPSTDPFTQTLLAAPLIGLYLGGAGLVRLTEQSKSTGELQ
ncbi:Sec-independent protein translocase protein TatC [Chloropicon primus]|uniref:Sec-independent protein translocase protein TatC n=1 Tax=Chloropicon primus TaxID=1764295 RepID=A0A5B8MLV8_9CHLO|nr:Sec-independent protein translocase protein TatC [Chloropicon primus]|eukprot:QDZ21429.1 Sec-independent protein translocase protein TatC [Chloropicon primus]